MKEFLNPLFEWLVALFIYSCAVGGLFWIVNWLLLERIARPISIQLKAWKYLIEYVFYRKQFRQWKKLNPNKDWLVKD